MLSHSPYIQGDSVHPLIQIFVLEPTGCMKADILHKAIHLLCQRAVLVGGTVRIADCLHLFKDAIPSVSSWLQTFFCPLSMATIVVFSGKKRWSSANPGSVSLESSRVPFQDLNQDFDTEAHP